MKSRICWIWLMALVWFGVSGWARGQGTYYDATLSPTYRGYVHDTRLWIPNHVTTIRGVIIIGNGALGDQRGRTAETDWQALARAHDFALMGTSLYICQSASDVNAEVPMLLADLAWYATASGHPEVTNLPFVLCGWSGGGQIAYGINTKIPERVIAYEVDKGGYYVSGALSAAALKTPAIYVAGQVDSTSRISAITGLFETNRPIGGLCALAIEENTGHAEGNVNSVFFTFFDHAIRGRYPAGVTPLNGPVTLLDLPETSGWLAAEPTVSNGLSGSVYAYANYAGTKTRACWLMDADVANLYRGFATYSPAVTVTPVGGPLFSAPQTIQFKVAVNSTGFPGWVSADVYDGAVKLGTVTNGGSSSVYAVRPWGGRDVTVIARDASGNERTSIPQPFVVNKNSAAAWNNGAGNFLWNTSSTNWGGAVWTPGADAVFGATGAGTVSVSGTQTLADSLTALSFDAAGYKLTGGTLALPGTSSFNVNADAEIASVITGAGNLIKSGSGTLTLSGSNDYYGNTAVNAGTLKLGNGGNLGNTWVPVISSLAIAQNANGSSNALTGYLTLYVGAMFTMADAHTSTFNVGAASLSAGTGAPPLLTFDLAAANQTSDRLAIAGGASIGATLPTIVPNFLTAPSASTNTYTLITALSGLGAANFNLATTNLMIGGQPYHTSLATSTATAVILSFEAGAVTLPVYWQGSIDGSWKSQNGGTLNTNFTNEATGATNTLALPNLTTNVSMTANSASNLTTTLDQAFTINGLTFSGGGSSNTAGSSIGAGSSGTLQINGGGITVNSGSGANTISAPLTLGAAQSWTNNSSAQLTIGNGSIHNGGFPLTVAGSGKTTLSGALSGAGGLTQSAVGTLTLAGSNTYTGATTINTGMLVISNAAALGSSTVNLVGGTLDLGTQNIANPLSLQSGTLQNGKVTLASGNFDIQFGTANWDVQLNGAAGLIKTTAGTATLAGANLYTGPTTIYAGTLAIGWWGSLASTSVVNLVGGTLELAGVGVSNGYPSIAPVSLQGGTVQNGVVNYNATTIDIQSGTETSTAVFAGYGGLIKTTSGTATLAGTNTYTGLTNVSAGTLLVKGWLNASSAVTVASTAILGGSGTINGTVALSAGGSIQLGASGATLSLANATAATYASTSTLKILASASTLDKISASATSGNSVANLDLVIDTTGLSGAVSSTLIYSAGGPITSPFHSVTVSGNTAYTSTLDYSTPGQIKLALTSGGGTPTSTGGSVSLASGSVKTFAAGDFEFSNGYAGNLLSAIKITSLPTHGTLKLNGTPITAVPSTAIPVASIPTLTYTPTVSYSGADAFNFQVSDGIVFSADATVAVIVNDAKYIPVTNGGFEDPTPHNPNNGTIADWTDGTWAYVGAPWTSSTALYGRLSNAPMVGTAKPGNWIVNLNDGGGWVKQDLATTVNAGDTLAVTFYVMSDTAAGQITATFTVGSTDYSQTFSNPQNDGVWVPYTLTKTVGVAGNLSVKFTQASGKLWLDNVSNVSVTGSSTSTPVIALTDTLAAVNTTYGMASVTPTSFHVSGSGLTGNLTVAPPAGYEVSLSSGSGYTTSLSITASGTLASTQVYVRLAATTAVNGGVAYVGNLTVAGGGASSKTLATASSTVAKATPTATLTVSNSPVTYDGTAKMATVSISISSVPGALQNILTGGAAAQTAAGTYAVTADFVPTDTANYSMLSAQAVGNFVIAAASGVSYASWASANSVTGAANADSNHDGVPNGIAYFMGVTGSSTLPGVVGNTVKWTNGGNIPSSAYASEFVVQTSSDLVNWTPVAASDSKLSNTAGSVSYTLAPGAAKRFVRLLVTPN